MKIIPKFQQGGGFNSFFTTYIPVQVQEQAQQKVVPTSTVSSKSQGESTKDKLTEKDLFDMLSDINGLPNDMDKIANGLLNMLQIENLTGVSTSDLYTKYIQNLVAVKIATQNKEEYDNAIKEANKKGSMAEPAISLDGRLIVQNSDGSISPISLEQYMNNRDQYANKLLSVSELANLRKYEPQLANKQGVVDIINNSMGYQEFQNLLSQAISTIGSSQFSGSGIISTAEAEQGLNLLKSLRKDDRLQVLGSVTSQGLYKYNIIDKNQKAQIDALTSYITVMLPNSAKTWAAIKLGTSNKDSATRSLILTYLLSKEDTVHSVEVSYTPFQKGSSSTDSDNKDPKEGFWRQVQSGRGGEDFTFTILTKTGQMSVDGKYYGTTPGMDQGNQSLGDYINNSKVGFLIKNNKNITFGDTKIYTGSFNDVMVNAYSGAAVVTLPIKVDGTVDLSLATRWIQIQDELRKSGIQSGTPQYQQKLQYLLRNNNMESLLDSSGLPNRNRFSQFLVLEGYTSDKAKAIQNDKQISFKDISSNFIISVDEDDDDTYNIVKKGLSNKDRGDYKLENGWFNSNALYKGNIYIPLNTNPINAQNADSNSISQSTSQLYEKLQQKNSTNSSEL